MQILKRAKNAEMDIVSASESESIVRDEVNHRTYKAGYTDRDGQPKVSRSNGAGKGDDTASRTNWKQWFSDKNPLLDRRLNTWPRDENGNLIDD